MPGARAAGRRLHRARRKLLERLPPQVRPRVQKSKVRSKRSRRLEACYVWQGPQKAVCATALTSCCLVLGFRAVLGSGYGLTFCCLVVERRAVLGSAGGLLVLLSCPLDVGRCMAQESSPHVKSG